MSVKIGHASIDENGKARGGGAGDQTKKEVCTRSWYDHGWNKVIRAKDPAVAEKIAKAMEQACTNNKIGYDQGQRTTLFTKAKAKNWDLSKIAEKCECDCSSLVAVCVNASGITVSKDIYTGNEANALKNTGKFTIYTASKYTDGDSYLKRGDILLKEGSHTAVVLSDGDKVTSSASATKPATNASKVDPAKSFDKSLAKSYTTTSALNLRSGAGTGKTRLTVIPKGGKVTCYGYYTTVSGTKWYLVVYEDYTGFCSSKYLKAV